MAKDDPIPDFSWLNKNEEAANQHDDEDSTSDPNEQAEHEQTVLFDADDRSETDDSETNDEINPTGETWIAPTNQIGLPVSVTNSQTPDEVTESEQEVDSSDGATSDSVHDDEGDEVISPTQIMPERVIPPAEKLLVATSEGIVEPKAQVDDDFNPNADTVIDEPSPTSTIEPPSLNAGFTGQLPERQFEEEFALPEEQQATLPAVEPSIESPPDADDSNSVEPRTVTESASERQSQEQPAKSSAPVAADPPEKSNLTFILLASYASAMTLVALILLMKGGNSNAKPHHLESLPDVAPESSESLSYVPVNASLPLGHVLKLGEKQRFGNIEVEPLRVVKEPLEFAHYSDEKLKRPASEPVYKLWLKFTNVSKNQEIAPLDGRLMLRWVVKEEEQREYSNYYLFPQGANDASELTPAYRHSKESDWDLKDQKLGTVLEPGASYETYLASIESPAAPKGPMIWRFQIRKGFSDNGGGVTTMVDVAFSPEDIKSAG